MRPIHWQPPIELAVTEQKIMKQIRRAKLFVFLREHRHEVFSEAFQEELAGLYAESPQGQPPVPPARLALATILQAYTGASDDEVIEASVMDRRWQLVLDCILIGPTSVACWCANAARTCRSIARPGPFVDGSRFTKLAFQLDWQQQRIRCPNQQEMPFEPGGTVHFPAEVCAACPLREQ